MFFKYTVVVPHYNNFEGVVRLVSSLPNRSDLEVVLIDDNSGVEVFDNLKKLLLNIDIDIRLYTNDSGFKGAGAARNIGLKYSIGKYIIFADSDDFFVDNAFDNIDDALEQADSDIYFFKPTSQCLITGKISDRHISYSKLIDDFLNDNSENIRYKFYVPWSKVYVRHYIIKHGFKFDQVIASNDVMFSLTSASKAKISVSEMTFYCVTRGVGTLTVNFSKKVLSARLKVSLAESKYIYDNDIEVEKDSVYSLIKKSQFKLSIMELKDVIKSYINGYIRLFPESYSGYILSPKKIYKRLLLKKTSLNDKVYRK